MRDFLRYWWRPSYWRYLSRKSWVRTLAIIAGVVLLSVSGFLGAQRLTETEPTVIARFVTTVRTVDGETITSVIKQLRTLTEPGSTDLVTVVRNGQTITIPAETVRSTDTVKINIKGDTVTDTEISTRTKTQTEHSTTTNTETQTVDHPTTTTETSVSTTTENRNVPGPERTVTETQTETETHTQTQTETETRTVTDTETVTETVTEPAP